jgi:exodeoxyribonuclease VII large subunit
MSRPVKTQWDFGDLFATPESQPARPAAPPFAQRSPSARKILSVTELTAQIRRLLEQQIGQLWVTGEITNLRLQSSGHIYFTLKDANAQLNCVLFRGEMQVDRALLQDGRKVTVQGDVTVYEPRGQYQLRVTAVELQGLGALQVAFERLKQKLKAEGLFAQERKRPLPRYPQRIGLVTSPTGAAIRDVFQVVERRNPALQIILAPCRVQGEGAADEIAAAIRLLNEFNASQAAMGDWLLPMDLILVTRGGGSLEDLWAFNEEVVARAIFESALPVVAAVGHEIDFTISDFVADLRAATPSAAAEIITEGILSSCQFLGAAGARLRDLVRQHLEDKDYVLTQIAQRLARVHPRRHLNDWLQQLDDLQASLLRSVKERNRQYCGVSRNLFARLSRLRPTLLLKRKRDTLRQQTDRLSDQAHRYLKDCQNQIHTLLAHLRLLGPEQVLGRGYSITTHATTGKVLRDAKDVRVGQRLKTRLKTGQVGSVVEE